MMRGKVILVALLVVALLVPALAFAQSKTTPTKGMYCDLTNEQFHQLCTNANFMGGLTSEQKKEIDAEWQRRVPNMTPEEAQKYYPAGRRYYTGS